MPGSDEAASAGEPLPLDEHPQRRREWAGGLRSVLLPVLLVLAVAGGVYYFQGRDPAATSPRTDGLGIVPLTAELDPRGEGVAPRQGRLAPDFLLEAADGSRIRLSDMRGHPVLINFWATWCAPCRAEMPAIQSVYEAEQSSGFVVLAVNVQESAARVSEWTSRFGLTFPVVFDTYGAVARAYRASEGLPASVFVDAAGRVQQLHLGEMDAAALREGLAAIRGGGNP
jgi:peroxiredoxin